MAQDLATARLRDRLKALKEAAGLNDTEIADHIKAHGVGFAVYQQKISEFFSGQTKNPPIALLVGISRALGVRLSGLIDEVERDVLREHDDADWRWLMLGRRLGEEGRRGVEQVRGVPPSASGATEARASESRPSGRALGLKRRPTNQVAGRQRGQQ